jgi:hypothetical protein
MRDSRGSCPIEGETMAKGQVRKDKSNKPKLTPKEKKQKKKAGK